MTLYRVSFTNPDGKTEAVIVAAHDAEDAQERAVACWEERGIVHGDLAVVRVKGGEAQAAAPAQPKTHAEFIHALIESSPYGALVQAFVLEAISRYADQVACASPAQFDSAMLSGRAWVGVARDVKARLKQHMEQR